MSDFNQDIENLLNAYDSNWEDYLILRKQFIEKYRLSVDKLEEHLNTAKKALTEIAGGHTVEDAIFNHQLIASEALAEIGGDDE
ncbi:hypothetical protein [Lactococcus taiwanensis]|uniref:hypothetical protein n=1 Tax=Lactococcus taiwanensis TaxID=1151742 RepID=UPI0035144CA0